MWPLTGKAIQKWSKDNATIKGGKVVRLNTDTSTARLLAAAIQDEQGNQQFSVADINRLMDQDASVVARLEKVARRLSGLLDDEDEDEESEGGDQLGNGFTPRTPSSTAWQPPSDTPAMSS